MELWGTTIRLWRVPDVFCEFGYRVGLGVDKIIGNEFDPGVMVSTNQHKYLEQLDKNVICYTQHKRITLTPGH
jgi:hypothetical protein